MGQLEKVIYKSRPSWERYFMDLAIIASSKASCIKRKVGYVITKDRRVICTGVNGTPTGTPNCCDGGCPRCNGESKSGYNLDLCVCLHAEESALLYQNLLT